VFSGRLKWDVHPNPISRLATQKRAAGIPVLDLTESNPTRAGISYSPELLTPLSDARALRYDPDPRGTSSARNAVADYYAQRGVPTDIDRILLTASTSEAYSYLFKLLADPGDEVLAPRPSYPLFEFLASLESVNVRTYPLRYDGAWHIDFDSLERAMSARTRAIVVVNPNNPTGQYLKDAELERLDSLCASRGIAILSDEVFCDYAHGEDAHRVRTLAGKSGSLKFCMSGLSKIAGLPQLKLGWIVANGEGAEEACRRLEWIADTYLSVGTPVQVALPSLMGSSVGDQIRQRTAENLRFLLAAVGGTAGNILKVEGGWYAVAQVPRTRSEEEWVLTLLEHHNVLAQPGFFYDFESEAFLILSLLTEPAQFREGVRRLLAIL
jgi:aspartate/methionine/tyrosine aminotransferase